MTAAQHLDYAKAGIAALQAFYNPATGLWNPTGWWNAANALETTIDYSVYTDTLTYCTNIFNTFEKNKRQNFLNEFYDDEGWWALTWIKAYDLTLRYAAGGDAFRYLYVNGRTIGPRQRFPSTGTWQQWRELTISSVSLKAGINTVSLIYDSSRGSKNWLNLDELTVW
jgi:hypothetical protein